MEHSNVNDAVRKAQDYLISGFHCSESMLIAMAEYYLGEVDPTWQKLTSGMGGGIGGSHQEVCGVITGAMNIIGLLYARTDPTINDDKFQEFCKGYLDLFSQELGASRCTEFREGMGYTGRKPGKPCTIIIKKGAKLLVQYLSDQENNH